MKNEALQDELLAINAIFPDSVTNQEGSENTFIVSVPDSRVTFYIHFDADYPSSSPRVSSVTGIDKAILEHSLEETRGIETLFALISYVQQYQQDNHAVSPPEDTSASYANDATSEDLSRIIASPIDWSIGEPIVDRKSTMLGRACRVTCREDLERALKDVAMDKRLQKASHPCIWACRHRRRSDNLLIQDNDDDGETAAGGRLAFLLEVTNSVDVLVVVSRWFGGILLGDIRFKHITTAARKALESGGLLSNGSKDHDHGHLDSSTSLKAKKERR